MKSWLYLVAVSAIGAVAIGYAQTNRSQRDTSQSSLTKTARPVSYHRRYLPSAEDPDGKAAVIERLFGCLGKKNDHLLAQLGQPTQIEMGIWRWLRDVSPDGNLIHVTVDRQTKLVVGFTWETAAYPPAGFLWDTRIAKRASFRRLIYRHCPEIPTEDYRRVAAVGQLPSGEWLALTAETEEPIFSVKQVVDLEGNRLREERRLRPGFNWRQEVGISLYVGDYDLTLFRPFFVTRYDRPIHPDGRLSIGWEKMPG